MPAPGAVVTFLASHTLLLLAALSVCAVAAEVMTLKLRPLVQIQHAGGTESLRAGSAARGRR